MDSQDLCRSKYTDLASISNEADNSKIASVAKSWNQNLWIGLFGKESSFRYWLSGAESWGNCASVAVEQQGRWIGADCKQKAAFVCEGGELLNKISDFLG